MSHFPESLTETFLSHALRITRLLRTTLRRWLYLTRLRPPRSLLVGLLRLSLLGHCRVRLLLARLLLLVLGDRNLRGLWHPLLLYRHYAGTSSGVVLVSGHLDRTLVHRRVGQIRLLEALRLSLNLEVSCLLVLLSFLDDNLLLTLLLFLQGHLLLVDQVQGL